MGQTSPKVKSKSLLAPPYRKVGHFHCPHTLPKGVTNVPITTIAYSHTQEKTAAPKAGTCAPAAPPKLDRGSYGPAHRLSQAPTHTLPGPGWAGVPTRHPPTLSRSTRSFSSSSSPRAARISSCSRRFSCAQRMELPAGRVGPPPPLLPSLLRGTQRGLPGLRGGGAAVGPGRGGGCGGADSAAARAGREGRGLPRPDSAEAWPSRNRGL